MPSGYPAALDAFSTAHADNVGEPIHAGDINDLADAVNKIEAAFGANPFSYGTLAARPSAASKPDRYVYFATDDNGGTAYQVQAGAWVKVAASVLDTGGRELGYAEITANVALTGSTADIPGLSITVTVGARPIKLIFDAQSGQISAAGNFNTLQIVEGPTILTAVQYGVASANTIFPLHREKRLAPSAGVHTYKIQGGVAGTAGATDRLVATATSPAFLQAVEC